MNYNPYAAPQALPSPGGQSPHGGPVQPWSVGEVLNAAFEAFKTSWPTVLGAMILFGICIVPFQAVPYAFTALDAFDELWISYTLGGISSYVIVPVIEAFLLGGLMRILLSVVRGQQASIGDLFSGANLFLPMLGIIYMNFALMLFGCCFGGFVLLGMGLSFAPFFVADQSMGPIDAMKAAWSATDGQRGEIFGFTLACVGVVIAGAIACGVGELVAYPVVALASAIVYVRITGRGGAPLALGPGQGFGGPPAGGFGGPGAPGGGFGGPPGYGPPPGGGGYGPPGGGYGPPGGAGGGRPPGY